MNMQVLENYMKNVHCLEWRMNNLYNIQTKEDGGRAIFKLRPQQEYFFKNQHTRNIILKARQLGFSTLIKVEDLDDLLFKSEQQIAIISQTLDSAYRLMEKITYAYEHLPGIAKLQTKVLTKNKSTFIIGRYDLAGKKITENIVYCGTSMRSGTPTKLHWSEMAYMCKFFPEKARETFEGTLPAVPQDCKITIETTAHGAGGLFHELAEKARRQKESKTKLTKADFKFFFFPWQDCSDYVLDAVDGMELDSETIKYREKLKSKNINVTTEQMFWWEKQRGFLGGGMQKEFPSYPEEAFEATEKGKIYQHHLLYYQVEEPEKGRFNHVREIEIEPTIPVNTAWDLGRADFTAIWFFQIVLNEIRVIDFMQGNDAHIEIYIRAVMQKNYLWGVDVLPHDAKAKQINAEFSVSDYFTKAKRRFEILTASRVEDGINVAISLLPKTYFKESTTKIGYNHLLKYSREWHPNIEQFGKPKHDKHSHPADAFRELCVWSNKEMNKSKENDFKEISKEDKTRLRELGY